MRDFIAYELLPIILNMTLTASIDCFGFAGSVGTEVGASGLFLRAVAGGAVPVAVSGVLDGGRLPDGAFGHTGDRGDRPC